MKINRREFLKLLSMAPLALAAGSTAEHRTGNALAPRQPASLPNILILVFDALSARNMSIYGYHRQTTPQLERLAKSANVYHRHYAGANFTSPGVASLLTGVYPWAHRGFNLGGTVAPDFVEKNLFSLLANWYHTFAYSHNNYTNLFFEQFRRSIDLWIPKRDVCLDSLEFAELLFPNNYAANEAESLLFWRLKSPSASYFSKRYIQLLQQAMMNRLSQQYQGSFPRGLPNFTTIFFTIEQAVDWLLGQAPLLPRPYVGYIHLFPPHFPYNTRREFVDIFDDGWLPPKKPFHPLTSHFFDHGYSNYQRRMYDEFIAYVDAEFGRLFDGLASAGALKDTLLIFTSDHGEMFERGILQHNSQTLFEPLVHIPLLIWKPGQYQRLDILEPTSCVDLLPTFLHLADQPVPGWCEGQVLPGFAGAPPSTERSLFVVEAKKNPKFAPLEIASLALVRGRHKLVHYFGYPQVQDRYEFYDLHSDPEELVDLADETDPQFIVLRQELEARLEQSNRLYRQG